METTQTACTFTGQITVRLRYLLFLPRGYGRGRPAKRWPLMLFLHGAGERGRRVSLVRKHGPPKIVETKRDFPFVLVSPQCPPEEWWSADALTILLDDVVARYDVDPDRIYVTGLSLGGFGTWALATADPDRFAAIAPVCGGGDVRRAACLKRLPVWAFHGAKDPLVPVERSREMIRAIKKAGGRKARLTIYPEAEHDSWTETYDNPALYEWLLKHKRPKRSARTGTRRRGRK
jgi:predicted peptidase